MMKLIRQIYAQVSIRPLKEVYTRTHPAKLTLDPELVAELDEEKDELAGEASTGNVEA